MKCINLKSILLTALLILIAASAYADGGTLRVGSPWGPKTLDVHKSGYVFQRIGITESMLGVDFNLKFTPLLAEKWSISDDKLTWTFNLRKGVKFHDGTLLTASIMVDNLKRLMKVGSLLKSIPIESITAENELVLKIKTSKPFAPLPAYLSKGEASALAPSSFDANGKVIKPIGTGPFAFESCKLKDYMTTKRFDEYWGPLKAKVDKVIYKGIPDAMTRTAMMKSGELDIAQIMPPEAIESLKSYGKKILTKPIGRTRIVGFNLEKGPFTDKKVRLAVNYAINRQDLVDYVLEGIGEPAISLFPPVIFWANTKLKGFPYSPEKAKELLAEAGWKDTDGDGILDKNGIPFEVKLVTYTERATLPPTAEVMQSQLQKVGIKTNLVVVQSDAAKKIRDSGEFGMFLVGRNLFFVSDPDYNLNADYFSTLTVNPGWGAYHYNNPEVDKLLNQGRHEFDTDKRKKIYDKIQTILLEDAPMAYLNYYTNIDAVGPNVKGYVMHPVEQCFHLERIELN
ncbi:ABC transporter substrate-binding protein [Maridesulfovibrio ferrireducens]|uniref:ABC transporter substrate-binding protein n=1 Tax=Maridesulfovibrio ferrireducens TaxID=246191 RepID=UPI001A2184B0|nr:ABC transporter substrate-binding protein [Maridesulfovibrio ferrireducens]MBI9110225.1 ABC transporter substrate-binding protein [Maridesulfovibrio ferrireducens]